MKTYTYKVSQLPFEVASSMNLKEMIVQLENYFSVREEVVCDIRVDGMLISDQQETEMAEFQVGSIAEIQVRTSDIAGLQEEVLRSLLGVCDSLVLSAPELTQFLRYGEEKHFYKNISGLLEQSSSLIEGMTYSGYEFRALSQALSSLMKQLSSVLEKRDFILAADLLEYDLLEKVNESKDAIRNYLSKPEAAIER